MNERNVGRLQGIAACAGLLLLYLFAMSYWDFTKTLDDSQPPPVGFLIVRDPYVAPEHVIDIPADDPYYDKLEIAFKNATQNGYILVQGEEGRSAHARLMRLTGTRDARWVQVEGEVFRVLMIYHPKGTFTMPPPEPPTA